MSAIAISIVALPRGDFSENRTGLRTTIADGDPISAGTRYPRFVTTRKVIASALALLALGAPRAGLAQSTSAVAEQLFLDGQSLMEHGKVSEACPKFAESQRLDPKLGTLLNLAACHEADGQLALAWSEFVDASALADRAKRSDRSAFAKDHIAALEKRLARLRITGPATSSPEAGLELRLDGKPLSSAALGTALPLDPGHHKLEAVAPGKKPWQTEIESRAGAESRVEIPALADESSSGAPPPAPLRVEARPEAPTSEQSFPLRTAGFVVGGVGIAGLAVGTIFGVLAFSKESQAHDVCPDAGCATPEGVNLHDSARTFATVSTIGFAAGALLTAGGLFLVLTAPKDPASASSQLRLRLAARGLDLTGSF
jgi:hypothetical protein